MHKMIVLTCNPLNELELFRLLFKILYLYNEIYISTIVNSGEFEPIMSRETVTGIAGVASYPDPVQL